MRAGVQALARGLATAASETPTVGRLNHVAIAVPCLEQAVQRFRTVLGVTVTEPRALPEHGVTVAFVELPNVKLELLEPLEMRGGTASPIASFLSNHKEGGIHHLCLEVDDIAASMQHVARHARLLDKRPKIGAHGLPVVFVHPKDMCGCLTELEEVVKC